MLTISIHTKQPIDVTQYEGQEPFTIFKHGEVPLFFFTPNQGILWRVNTLYTKEPDTIAWLSSFKPDEVMIDVGANIGLYSVFAAKVSGAKVYAFEPESQNYAVLNRNLYYNQLDKRVIAYPIALADQTKVDALRLSLFQMGGSYNTFSDVTNAAGVPLKPAFTQGCFGTTLDKLIADGIVETPDYIKIDVDGIEPKVLSGMLQTLSSPRLKSVLVEVDTNVADYLEIMKLMKEKGFTYSEAQMMESQRKEGPCKGVGNVIFTR
jgi:FkbM family methyltransferase